MLAGDLPPPRRGHQDHTTHSESTPRLLRAGSPTPRRQQHTDWGRGPSVADVGTPTLWDGSHPSGRKSQWATPDEAWPLSGGCSRSAHHFSGFCVGFFLAALLACRSSWARELTHATAVAHAAQ